MSRLILTDKQGTPKLLIDEFDQVHTLTEHKHVFDEADFCMICTATRSELEEDNNE